MATVYVRKDTQQEFQPQVATPPSGCFEDILDEETGEIIGQLNMCLLMPGYRSGSNDIAEEDPEDSTKGVWVDGTTDEQRYAELVAMGTAATNTFIQSPINDYNLANGLEFENVHNCNSYIQSPDYPHYQFCKEVWDWSVVVWEECRVIQAAIAAGTQVPPATKEEFWKMLTPYTGFGAVIPEPEE